MKHDREALDAVDQRRAHPRHLSGQLEVREASQQLLEEDPDLEPREVGTQAEMLSDAEALMRRGPGATRPIASRFPSFAAIRSSDQSLKCFWSSRGTPRSSAITSTGSGTETSSTKSTTRPVSTASSDSYAISRMRCSSRCTERGVKKLLTRPR